MHHRQKQKTKGAQFTTINGAAGSHSEAGARATKGPRATACKHAGVAATEAAAGGPVGLHFVFRCVQMVGAIHMGQLGYCD